jgi:hypothetical protein
MKSGSRSDGVPVSTRSLCKLPTTKATAMPRRDTNIGNEYSRLGNCLILVQIRLTKNVIQSDKNCQLYEKAPVDVSQIAKLTTSVRDYRYEV